MADEEEVHATASSRSRSIRRSFVTKLGSLMTSKQASAATTNDLTVLDPSGVTQGRVTGEIARRASKFAGPSVPGTRTSGALRSRPVSLKGPPLPPIDPEDLKEMRAMVLECADPETRRGGLLGLFKFSLKEGYEPHLVNEGAAQACCRGVISEEVGSAGRRAAMQAIRNMAQHPLNQTKLVDVVCPLCISVIEEESPGSGAREASLETLRNLAVRKENRADLAAMENLMNVVTGAAKSEARGSQAREAALSVLESVSSDGGVKRSNLGGAAAAGTLPAAELDIKSIVELCVETISGELPGSFSRVVAARTLRQIFKSFSAAERTLIVSTPNMLEACVSAARSETPGSEARSALFQFFANVASYPDFRAQLAKTRDLAETIVAAVRDEPQGSTAREWAMFTVAGLCHDPDHRAAILKGAGEQLVSTCVRASKQEADGSNAQAAALELLAGLALAPENRTVLYATPGLIDLAVKCAADVERSSACRSAGLELIASLANAPEHRSALFGVRGLVDVMMQAICEDEESAEMRGAGLALLRALGQHEKNIISLRTKPTGNTRFKTLLEAVLDIINHEDPGSRVRAEAIGVLFDTDLAEKSKNFATKEPLCAALVLACRTEPPGSASRSAALELLSIASLTYGAPALLAREGVMSLCVGTIESLSLIVAPKAAAAGGSSALLLRHVDEATLKSPEGLPPRTLARRTTKAPTIASLESVVRDAELGMLLISTHVRLNKTHMPFGTIDALEPLCRDFAPEHSGTQRYRSLSAFTLASQAVKGEANAARLFSPGLTHALIDEILRVVSDIKIASASPVPSKRASLIMRRSSQLGAAPAPPSSTSGILKHTTFGEMCVGLLHATAFDHVAANATQEDVDALASSLISLSDNPVPTNLSPFLSDISPDRIHASLIGALHHLLHVPALLQYYLISEKRPDLDAALSRVVTKGSNEDAWFVAGKRAQAFQFALRLMGNVTPSPQASPQAKKAHQAKQVCLMSGDMTVGVLEASQQAAEALKKLPKSKKHAGFDPHNVDAGFVALGAAKKRKACIESALEAMREADLILFLVNETSGFDPVLRTYLAALSQGTQAAVVVFYVQPGMTVLAAKAERPKWFAEFLSEAMGHETLTSASVEHTVATVAHELEQ